MLGLGAVRTVRTPPTAPARYGMASRDSATGPAPVACGTGGEDGSAASIGNSGSGPRTDPVGATTVPTPKAKPGPMHVGHRPDDRVRQVGEAGQQQQPDPTGPGESSLLASRTR